jgi:hypothetical protein
MNNYSAIPVWNIQEERLVDGTFFGVPDLCNKQKHKTCKKHYESILAKKGFFVCPAGMTSYSPGDGERIYSGIRVSGYYDNKKTKLSNTFMPTIPPNIVLESVFRSSSIDNNKSAEGDVEFDRDLVDFCLHEVRKFNLIIKRNSEEFLTSNNKSAVDHEKHMKTIFASSTSITNRLNIYDFENNPNIVTASTPFQASVFQKFQKASHCLEIYARDAGVRICGFKGQLRNNIDMFPIFDFVPHVLLENAIKYSPKKQDIEVTFSEMNTSFEVTVESIGPAVSKDEISIIFEKGKRAHFARLVDTSGGGYGLYFAKLICDLHQIELKAKSGEPILHINNIPYSKFEVTLSYSSANKNGLQRTKDLTRNR